MLFAQVLLAAEEDPEGIDLLLPPTDELIAGIIAFGIVFFFIWKWALPAINKGLEARRDAITGQLQEAESAKAEAKSLLTDYQEQMAGARDEANRIIEEARQSADALKSDMIAKAEAEANEIRTKARRDADAEMRKAQGALRGEVASLSMDVAEKVIGQSLDRDAQSALVERYINELQGMKES